MKAFLNKANGKIGLLTFINQLYSPFHSKAPSKGPKTQPRQSLALNPFSIVGRRCASRSTQNSQINGSSLMFPSPHNTLSPAFADFAQKPALAPSISLQSLATLALELDCECENRMGGALSGVCRQCEQHDSADETPRPTRFLLDMPMFPTEEDVENHAIHDVLTLDLCIYLTDFLDVRTLSRLGRTCRFWRELALDEMAWKHKVVSRFNVDPNWTAKRLRHEPFEQSWHALYTRLDLGNSSFKGFAIDRATNSFRPYPFEAITCNDRLPCGRKGLTKRLTHITESRRDKELELERLNTQYDGNDHPLAIDDSNSEVSDENSPSSFWTSPVIEAIFAADEQFDPQPAPFLTDLVPSPTRAVRGNIRWPTLGDALSKIRGTIVEDHLPVKVKQESTKSMALARAFVAASPLPDWIVPPPIRYDFHPVRFETDEWTGCSKMIEIQFEEFNLVRGQDIAIPNQYHCFILGPVLLGVFDPGHPQFLGAVVGVMEEALPRAHLKPLLGHHRGYMTNVQDFTRHPFQCSLSLSHEVPSNDFVGIVSGRMRVTVILEVRGELVQFDVDMSLIARVSRVDEVGQPVEGSSRHGIDDGQVLLDAVLTLEAGTREGWLPWLEKHLPIDGQACQLLRKGDFLLGFFQKPKATAFYFHL